MHKKELKELFEQNFRELQEMSVPEYTLYRKWVEINNIFKKQGSPFIGNTITPDISGFKEKIWIPNCPEDYRKLDPYIWIANDSEKSNLWNKYRILCTRLIWKQSPGRLLRFLIIDKKTEKILGIASLGSDFISVGGRDEIIGWTRKDRLDHKMLNYTAMGSTIVATQPLGYNYLGGKLITLLMACDEVEKAWNEKYQKELLAGITTTSLYGGFSQYNNLKYWKKCRTSKGEIPMEPSEDISDIGRQWLRENYPEEYEKTQTAAPNKVIASHPKHKALVLLYKKLGIKPPKNNAPRGVYWCRLYKNTNEFLRREHQKLNGKAFDNSVSSLTELWKYKYAKKRIDKLRENDRMDFTILFYDKMISKTWEETKELYLEDR